MELEPHLMIDQSFPADKPLVLAVEDDEDSLVLLTQVLDLLNCHAITARDGQTALSLAQAYKPNLILMDIVLPGIDGMSVVRSLKQSDQTSAIPVVAVTALARTDDQNRILASGCDTCISKPYFLDELEALIQRYLSPLHSLPCAAH